MLIHGTGIRETLRFAEREGFGDEGHGMAGNKRKRSLLSKESAKVKVKRGNGTRTDQF